MAPSSPDTTEAVQVLYRQHHGWLVELLRRKLGGHRDNAVDLAHDTFERVMRAGVAATLTEPRGYLTTVAQRLAIDHFRRNALERAYLETLALQPAAVAPSPEEKMVVMQALAAVCAMLDGMPARTRKIFVLAQIEGASYPQAAQALGVSVNVVQKEMIRAWKHCHDAIYG
jgi:RNA polymerase sigma-70 factor (ECF subfamily)